MRSFTFETRKKLYFAPQPHTKMPPADPNNAVAAPDRPPALLVRTRVPVFAPTETESAACAKEKAFCEKLNRRYASFAESYFRIPHKVLHKDAAAAKENGCPCALLWQCEVPFNAENAVSLFTDISGFDAKTTAKRRVCTLWSLETGTLLVPSQVFYTGRSQRKAVIDRLCTIAENNLNRKLFTYYDNFEAILHKHFSFGSSYFVPNGVAFCFDGGVLNARKEEIAVFVLRFEELNGILKFVPKTGTSADSIHK